MLRTDNIARDGRIMRRQRRHRSAEQEADFHEARKALMDLAVALGRAAARRTPEEWQALEARDAEKPKRRRKLPILVIEGRRTSTAPPAENGRVETANAPHDRFRRRDRTKKKVDNSTD